MQNGTARPPRNVVGTYGTSATFTALRQDLLSSAAWLTLRDSSARILIDFITRYNAETNYDRDPTATTKPVLYTFGDCALTCAKNTFYRSMRELQEHGFLEPYWKHRRRRGQATRWTASTRWQTWRPDLAQLRILNDYTTRRSSSVTDRAQQIFPFVTRLEVLNRMTEHDARRAVIEDDKRRAGIVHVGQVTQVITEELWTQRDSHRQAQQHQSSNTSAHNSRNGTKPRRRTMCGE